MNGDSRKGPTQRGTSARGPVEPRLDPRGARVVARVQERDLLHEPPLQEVIGRPRPERPIERVRLEHHDLGDRPRLPSVRREGDHVRGEHAVERGHERGRAAGRAHAPEPLVEGAVVLAHDHQVVRAVAVG